MKNNLKIQIKKMIMKLWRALYISYSKIKILYSSKFKKERKLMIEKTLKIYPTRDLIIFKI